MNRPERAIVLSVDEKTSIQATQRKHPDQPVRRGRLRRREFHGSSHVSKHTKAWLAAHPRWVAHSTPVHASWVNQVELFFSILQRKVIGNGSFTSRDDLIAKLLAFLADYDQTAKPFKWTYAADPLKAA